MFLFFTLTTPTTELAECFKTFIKKFKVVQTSLRPGLFVPELASATPSWPGTSEGVSFWGTN